MLESTALNQANMLSGPPLAEQVNAALSPLLTVTDVGSTETLPTGDTEMK